MLRKLAAKRAGKTAVAGLETTKAALEARIPMLETAKAAALDRRREALIADPTGAEASETAEAARTAESELAAVADALQEVARRIAEANARAEADRAKAEREAIARALEADAAKIRSASAEMAAAVEAVVKTHARLVLGASGRASPQLMDDRPHLTPEQFADGVLLQTLAAGLPHLDVRAEVFPGAWTQVTRVEGRDSREAGEEAANRLRDVAARVRAEELPADLPEWSGSAPSIYVRDPEGVDVYPTKCFSWIDGQGQTRRTCPAECFVPAPVAEAAIQAGAAERSPSWTHQQAKADWNARRDRTPAEKLFDGERIVDIGVNLQELREAEEERRRAAWRAEQDAARAELVRRAA